MSRRNGKIDNIMEIKRTSDILMSMKLVKQNGKINIVSAYAPQVGCSLDEKEAFWEELEDLIRGFPEDEQVIIGADLNGQVGKENGGYEQWHGGYSYGARNVEGEELLEFSQAHDMAIANTFFKKRDEHYICYKSGPNKTVIDYILIRRRYLKSMENVKIIPGEAISTQHRILVADMYSI